MSDPLVNPGEAADQAFTFGVRVAAVGGLAGIGGLYWAGVIDLFSVAVTLVLLFPIYLIVVASVLSKWLGLDKDIADLRPVSREQETGPWEY